MKPLFSLTSLRFFAALWVVLYHLPPGAHMPFVLGKEIDTGYEAVEFFFVLSGFILVYSYLGRTAIASAREFWVARLARIYPMYALAMLISIPELLERDAVFGPIGIGARAIPAFAMLQSWHSPTALDFNTPSWSLSVEAFFYAIFPLVLPTLARLPPRRLIPGLAVTAVGGLAIALLWSRLFPDASAVNGDLRLTYAKFFPLVHLPAFLFGAVLGRLFVERPGVASSPRNLAVLGWGATLALIACAFVPGFYILKHSGGLIALYGALIWALAHERGLSARFFAWPPLVLLGEASYGVYILHAPMLYWWMSLNDRFNLHLSVADRTGRGAFIVAINVLAVLVYKSFEVPARDWIRGRSTRIDSPPARSTDWTPTVETVLRHLRRPFFRKRHREAERILS